MCPGMTSGSTVSRRGSRHTCATSSARPETLMKCSASSHDSTLCSCGPESGGPSESTRHSSCRGSRSVGVKVWPVSVKRGFKVQVNSSEWRSGSGYFASKLLYVHPQPDDMESLFFDWFTNGSWKSTFPKDFSVATRLWGSYPIYPEISPKYITYRIVQCYHNFDHVLSALLWLKWKSFSIRAS